MSKIYLPLKIYKYENNTETYLWDQDWLVLGSKITAKTSNWESFAQEAVLEANGDIITQLYIGSPGNVDLSTAGKMVDVTPFIGKTIRCYLKGDDKQRMIQLVFGSLGQLGTLSVDQTFWMNGAQKFYITGGIGQILNNGNDQARCTSIAFPIKDGNTYYTQWVGCLGRGDTGKYNAYSNSTGRGSSVDIANWLDGYVPVVPDEDNPYWDGGTSSESDSNGNFSEDSDSIGDEGLPSLSAVGTGFATIFTPSATQLRNLATIMWNQNVFAALQNLVENINDMFTGLSIVPFEVTQGRTVDVTWLGLFDTGVALTLAANQFYDIPMGSIDLSDDSRIFTSGSALDYAPFSKLGIYLPFIGFQELDIDECRNAVIGLHYKIDILSGTCVAMISLDGNEIYQFTGNCLTQIPITNQSLESLVSDAVQVGIAISNTGATAASATGEVTEAASSEDGANFQDIANAHQKITRSGGQLVSATANAMMGMKPTMKKSGAVSAAASLMSIKQPYLFLTTPRQSMPNHYQRYCGFPSNITGTLNSFTGFTVVESIRLNHLVATSPEVAEIYDLLKKGVII